MEDLRAACHPDSPARQGTVDVFGNMPFPKRVMDGLDWRLPREQGGYVYDVQAAGDLCRNPLLADQHGNFLQPFVDHPHQRNRLYPIFSWSRYLSSSDIGLPTNIRWHTGGADQTKWAEMKPAMVWRGGSTGMYAYTRKVLKSHRHAFMLRLYDLWGTEDVLAQDVASGGERRYRLMTVFRHQFEKWFNIGLQHYQYHLETEAEKMFEDVIPEAPWMSTEERKLYKIALDIDGWGWSARFRELLRSSR